MVRVWKPRFRLRTVLIAVALCAVACAMVSEEARWRERQRRSRRIQAIRAALEAPLTMRLAPPSTLGTGLKAIRNYAPDLWIDIDPSVAQEVRAALTTPVTLDADGIPVKEVLMRLLNPLGLTYYVDADGSAMITSAASAGLPPPRAD
jgi:hypothetical protein